MAVNVIGFDNADITEAGFAKLMRAHGDGGYRHGITAGLTVSAAAGTRQVSVSAGTGFAPGLLFELTAAATLSLSANSGGGNRVDYVVMSVDWTSNTAALAVVPGSSSTPPALTQVEGSVWQVPLARVTVRPGATSIQAADVVVCKPLARVARTFTADLAQASRGPSSGVFTVATISIPDPGWPYVLDCDASVFFSDNANGYGVLEVWVNGSMLQHGTSGPLSAGSQPAHVAWPSGTLTGPATVLARIQPRGMSSGTLATGTNYDGLAVVQRPA